MIRPRASSTTSPGMRATYSLAVVDPRQFPDGSCGRLVRSQAHRPAQRDLARRRARRRARRELRRSRPATRRSSTCSDAAAAGASPGSTSRSAFPAWFARRARLRGDRRRLGARRTRDGERGWRPPTPPFWRDRCEVPAEQRFRRCEAALRRRPPKSIFQLVGNGQVGAGSVRGMPLPRAAPREPGSRSGRSTTPADRDRDRDLPDRCCGSRSCRDAADHSPNDTSATPSCSALVMWDASRNGRGARRRDRSRTRHRGRCVGAHRSFGY